MAHYNLALVFVLYLVAVRGGGANQVEGGANAGGGVQDGADEDKAKKNEYIGGKLADVPKGTIGDVLLSVPKEERVAAFEQLSGDNTRGIFAAMRDETVLSIFGKPKSVILAENSREVHDEIENLTDEKLVILAQNFPTDKKNLETWGEIFNALPPATIARIVALLPKDPPKADPATKPEVGSDGNY